MTAPAGSGKTTLIASYLDTRHSPAIWYRIDEGDTDVASFFYHLGIAIKRASRRRKPLPPFNPEYLQGLSAFTLRYFEALYSSVKSGSIIVFDNYERLRENALLHRVLSEGLTILPDGTRVFIASRQSPPPHYASLALVREMCTIGWGEIRFDHGESKEIARMRAPRGISEEVMSVIYDRAQGWVSGLLLMIEGLKTKEVDCRTAPELPPREVFSYFASEIFDKAGEDTKHFLLKTAFLPTMTAESAERLTGMTKSVRLLSSLHENRYFIEKYPGPKVAYRYHPLFRDYLRSTAADFFSPGEIAEIQRQSARILLEAGQREEAVRLFESAKDWETVIPVVVGLAPALLAEGRARTLEEWIETIPAAERSRVPWLIYWLGICKQGYSPTASRLLLEKAFSLFEKEADVAGSLLAWSGVVGAITYESMDFRQLDPLIAWMDGNIHLLRDVPEEIEAAVATGMMIGLLVRQPSRQDLADWTEKSLSLARNVSSTYSRMYTYIWIATACWWFGDYARAEMVVGEVEKAVKTGEPFLAVTWHFLAAAVRNQVRPNDDSPLSIVNEGLQIAIKSGLNQWVPLLMAEGFLAAINKGDIKTASRFITQMESIRDEVPNVMRCRCNHSSSLYHLIAGDPRGAVKYAEETLRASVEGGWTAIEAYSRLVLSLVLTQVGEFEKARVHLRHYREHEIPSPLFHYTRLVVEAALALQEGKDGTDILKETFSLARREGFINLFTWWQPSLMLRLCEVALEKGIEVDYVHHIIRIRNLLPEQPPLNLENWPWPVRIYTLGTFQILQENLPVPFSRKAQKKPLQMLKAIIAAGGIDVSEARLTEMLWPDSAGDAAYSAFTTTLSRLRHLLKHEEAIVVHDGRVSLDRRHVWVDAWSFDRLTRQAMDFEGPAKRTTGLAGQAISLYRGHFLASEDEYWVLSPRESFRNKFLRLILKVADQEDGAGNCEEAVSFYQKGLEIDDTDEELYQRLIICYKKAGRIPEALNVFKRCKAVLQARLGIAPSLKTQALYYDLF